MTTHTTIQSLMNQAYDFWKNEGKELDYNDFIKALPEKQAQAVIIGNLNYQVENGGFSQWAANGYSDQIERLKMYLRLIATESAKLVHDTLEEFEVHAAECSEDDEEDWDFDYSGLRTLDNYYYSLNEQFLTDAEAWINR